MATVEEVEDHTKVVESGNWNATIETYNEIKEDVFGHIGRRGSEIWIWTEGALKATELCSFNQENPAAHEVAMETKKLLVLSTVLKDDIADEYSIERARIILGALLNRTYPPNHLDLEDLNLTEAEKRYIIFTRAVDNRINTLASLLPGFKTHEQSLERQLVALDEAFKYSFEIRQDPGQISLPKYVSVLSNNMCAIINGVIDLMKLNYASTIYDNDNNNLMILFTLGQSMGRIVNSAYTYTHEIKQGDFSSEIVAIALAEGKITVEQLRDSNQRQAIIDAIQTSAIAQRVLGAEWDSLKRAIDEMKGNLPDLDIANYLKGINALRLLNEQFKGKI